MIKWLIQDTHTRTHTSWARDTYLHVIALLYDVDNPAETSCMRRFDPPAQVSGHSVVHRITYMQKFQC